MHSYPSSSPFRKSVAIVMLTALASAPIFAPALDSFAPHGLGPRTTLTGRLSKTDRASSVRGQTASMMAMPLVAPLFIVNEEFTSTLVLVNGTGINTYADISLRAPDGGEIVHQRVSFSPLSRRQVDVGALLASSVSQHNYGSIVVNPAISGSAIAAALSVTYVGGEEPNYVDEELAMPTPEGSQTLRAVADAGEGSPLIAVSSLAQSEQHVKINCLDGANHPFSKTIELPAEQTVLTEGCTGRTLQNGDVHTFLAAEQDNSYPATGISLASDAMPGSYAAFALRAHRLKEGKYFSSIALTDPKMLMSSDTVFTGVPVGSTTLLPGGEYMPEVSLANFSNRNANVTVRYAVTFSGKADVSDVKSLLLPAGTSSTIRLENLPSNPELKNSFLVASDGAPGDVMSKLVSRSGTAIREVELLGKDQNDPNNGGNHPWSLEEESDSTLLLFNPSQKAQKFTVAIQGGALLWQKAFNLESMQTEAISIRDLIQGEVKDDKGLLLHKDLRSGQVGWRSPLTGKGRLLQSSRNLQMARSFSCGQAYVLCGITYNGIGGSIPVGASSVSLGYVTPSICLTSGAGNCSGSFVYPGDNGFHYYWYSDNTGTITIASSSLLGSEDQVNVNGVAAGSAGVYVQISDSYHCSAYAQGTGTVQVPTSLSIVSGTDSTTAEASCTTGGGLAGCGVTRTFKYQVNDQNGQPIRIANMAFGDVICNTSTNQLNLKGYKTTCGGTTGSCSGTAGPCGQFTDSSGQFTETLTVCAPACKPSGTCTTAGQTIANQTWTVAGHSLSSDVKSISYQCNKILVNGK